MVVRRVAVTLLLGAGALVLGSCGGGSSPATGPTNTDTLTPNETRAALKILPIPGTAAKVALFADGRAFYSPDGFNLGGGGQTVPAYSGNLQVVDIVAVAGGIDALLSDGSVYFSPDGQNLGGGGASKRAYAGTQPIASLTPVGSGVDAAFSGGGPVYYSPDGLNLGGGGTSLRVYAGGSAVLQIVPVGSAGAVDTLLAGGAVYYSKDNRDIGGGGSTIPAAPGAASPVTRLVAVGGGVLAALGNGDVYLSPDGMNLAGGGSSVSVPAWNSSVANGPFPARDSAHGAVFSGRLWLSGGFADPTNSNSCFTTCSFFDLWSSMDALGTTWNLGPSYETETTPDPRDQDPVTNNGVQDVPAPTDFYDSYSALVVWNGELTAIGSTVWRSVDGTTWTRNNLPDGSAAPGPLATRATENSRAVVLGTSLFFLQPDIGEVYVSTDPAAATWTDLGPIPGFALRCGAAAFVLSGKIWIVGGGACNYSQVYNDVWSSADGVNWTRSAAPAAWSARMWACATGPSDGIVWLSGGYAPTDWNNTNGVVPRYGANHADVWYSRDGGTWHQFKADSGSLLPDDGVFEPRHASTCFIGVDGAGDSNLVVLAGTGGSDPNDNNARVVNSIRLLSLPASTSLP